MPSTPDPLRPREERLAEVYRRAGRHQRRRQAALGAAAVAILLPALAAVALQGGDGETTLVADAPTSTTSSSTTLTAPATTTTTAETTASTATTSTTTPAAEADPEATAGTAPPATTTTTATTSTTTTSTPPPVDHGAQLRDRSFRSRSVTEGGQPKPLVEGTTIDVQFAREQADDLIRWRGGCNTAGGPVTVTADRLDITDGGSSAMGCSDERSDQEIWVSAFFLSNPYWVSEGARLTLTSGDTVIELEEIPFDDFWRPAG